MTFSHSLLPLLLIGSILLSGCYRRAMVTRDGDVLIVGIERGNGPSFSIQIRPPTNTFAWRIQGSNQRLNVKDAIKINDEVPRSLADGMVECRIRNKAWLFEQSTLKGSFTVTEESVIVDLGRESPLSGTYERRVDD